MHYRKIIFILFIIGVTTPAGFGKEPAPFNERVYPCAIPEAEAFRLLKLLGPGWGYNYDSLLADLERWAESPFVRIDSAGTSVQGRTLWTLAVTDTSPSAIPRERISIHARTHPQEVQSSWITRDMIDLLLSDSLFAEDIRERCIVNIMPMYNPDGVELGIPRHNANDYDLERNWDKNPHQPETAALKALFQEYMASESPVRIALNMHSSSDGKRFFVFHHENGTSVDYTELEKRYIDNVRNYWPEGIQSWDYVVTWASGTPTHYPESWFWLNYGESVMALTYEDIYGNDDRAAFSRVAHALLKGSSDYLFPETGFVEDNRYVQVPSRVELHQNYPNPFNATTTIRYYITDSRSVGTQNVGTQNITSQQNVEMTIHNVLGQKIATLVSAMQPVGEYTVRWNATDLPGGVYFCRLSTDNRGTGIHGQTAPMIQSRKMILLK